MEQQIWKDQKEAVAGEAAGEAAVGRRTCCLYQHQVLHQNNRLLGCTSVFLVNQKDMLPRHSEGIVQWLFPDSETQLHTERNTVSIHSKYR